MAQKVAVVCGAGPGLGASISKALATKGYAVALLTRSDSSALAKEIRGGAQAFQCDVSQVASVQGAFKSIKGSMKGPVRVAVFNANSPFRMKSALELTPAEYEESFAINATGAFVFAQEAIKAMQAGGAAKEDTSTLLFTGATAAVKGGANFAGFAPSKFALRGLSQCLAREFGPKGIHVAHVQIDGLINTDRIKSRMGDAEQGTRLEPDDIAQTYMALVEQPRSCWTQEIDVRPFSEKW